MSNPKRYAPVIVGTIPSPFDNGYGITTSFEGLLFSCVLIDRLF